MRKIQLHWQWSEQDKASIRKAQEIMKEEFAHSGIGNFEIASKDGDPHIIYTGTHHHMGTTRMHTNPRQGVVDENCRVHGVENLYVSSSSVFPTGGFVNPTLTIVALSIRIADHVTEKLSAHKQMKAEI